MDENIIPIDGECKRFYHHLLYNERVIFSAKFGDGKTFFLNSFFQQNSDKLFCIKVYPINYQVEENKDIFELIKKDILIQLLAADEISGEQILDDTICRQYYLWNNGGEIFGDILSCITAIDTPVKIIKKLLEHIKDYKQQKTEVQKTDRGKVEEYIEFFKNKPGSCEYDVYSTIITDCINRIKNKGKRVVLVIEDLDRIDPAHLFRILNVLTAHIDIYNYEDHGCEYKNKFGFNHIVLVCDFQNIEKIFRHFYGDRTDFKGYIHKFSTSNPFYYSLKEVIQDHLFTQLNDMDLLTIGALYVKELIIKIVSQINLFSLREICSKFKMDFDNTIIVREANGYSLRTPFMKFLVLCYRFDIDPNELLDIIFKKAVQQNEDMIKFYQFVGIHWIEVFDTSLNMYRTLKIPATAENGATDARIFYSNAIASPKYLDQIKRITKICKSKYLNV